MEIETISVLVIGLSGVAVLLLLLYKVAGSMPIHALIYSSVWGPCLGFSQFALEGAVRPSAQTTLVLIGAWWVFLIGSIAPLVGERSLRSRTVATPRVLTAFIILYSLLALQWAGALYEILQFQTAGRGITSASIVDDLAAMRVSGETAEIHLPLFLGSFRWAHVVYLPLAMLLRKNGKMSRIQFMGILTLGLVSALLHFTRAPLVQLSVVSFVCWQSLYRPSQRRLFLLAVAIGICLLAAFVAAQVAINQQSSTKASLEQSLTAYFGMSPLAFEDILHGGYPRMPGIYSLDTVYFLLNKVGSPVVYPGLARPQIWFPQVTNVYTYLDVFTLDAGIGGALAGAFLVGIVCSFIFEQHRRKCSLWTLSMYSYFSYCCLMTPINNEFIRVNTMITLVLAWIATRCITRTKSTSLRVFRGARMQMVTDNVLHGSKLTQDFKNI